MADVIGYVVIVLFILVFTYGLVIQVQHTLTIQKANTSDVSNYRRLLFGNYVTSLSFFGFLISYILNVLVALQIIQLNFITSDNTGFSCFVFLVVLLIAKFGVIPIPKKRKRIELLK
ncbi:hypothetical protein MHH85_11370 [Viridibacillus sp. FSL E2-0187]|uniref:hypothetical protein n=1 Tax=Viridibacillus TaxID=496496 RepID=UPI0030F93C92